MKKVVKYLITAIAVISLGIIASSVLSAAPEVNKEYEFNPNNPYCVYQTMAYCSGFGLTFSCKAKVTADPCRSGSCCYPF